MSWAAPEIVLFDGEDEEELKSRFVELSARYPEETCFSIAKYVFDFFKLPDSTTRSMQAGLVWSNDLAVKERIRKAKLGGGKEEEEYTKQQWEAEVLAITRDPLITPTAKKAVLEGLNLFAQAKGWLAKPSEAGAGDRGKFQMPTFVIAQYPD